LWVFLITASSFWDCFVYLWLIDRFLSAFQSFTFLHLYSIIEKRLFLFFLPARSHKRKQHILYICVNFFFSFFNMCLLNDRCRLGLRRFVLTNQSKSSQLRNFTFYYANNWRVTQILIDSCIRIGHVWSNCQMKKRKEKMFHICSALMHSRTDLSFPKPFMESEGYVEDNLALAQSYFFGQYSL
jgi:hypothetical protein